MLNLEIYRKLKEIQSLFNLIETYKTQIIKHQERITLLQKQNTLRTKESEVLSKSQDQKTKAINSLELNLDQNTKTIEKLKENFINLTSETQLQAYYSDLSKLEKEINKSEETLLMAMEECEEIEQKIDECKNFSKGFQKSLEIITKEVNEDVSISEKEITNFKERIKLLLTECPDHIKTKILSLQRKYECSLAYVKDNCCEKCGMEVEREFIAKLDKGVDFQHCFSCGRIFIPDSIN